MKVKQAFSLLLFFASTIFCSSTNGSHGLDTEEQPSDSHQVSKHSHVAKIVTVFNFRILSCLLRRIRWHDGIGNTARCCTQRWSGSGGGLSVVMLRRARSRGEGNHEEGCGRTEISWNLCPATLRVGGRRHGDQFSTSTLWGGNKLLASTWNKDPTTSAPNVGQNKIRKENWFQSRSTTTVSKVQSLRS